MLCNECNKRQATIHLTQIVGEIETKRDLCEICGEEFLDLAKNSSLFPPYDDTGKLKEAAVEMIFSRELQYSKDAYLFVLAGMQKAFVKHFQKPHNKTPGHISGAELLEALREYALDAFGKAAKSTLKSWGVTKCEDFGEIVFNLVEAGLLGRQPSDCKEDFQNGYDFDQAFPT
jgi:uncharacterized repeat protein (TIGR04138 family)